MRSFGHSPDGKEAFLYTLENTAGTRIEVTNLGCAIVRWCCPDRRGDLADVVLGFDQLAGYLGKPTYFGAVVGRFANRIASGRFELDGKTYELAANNQPAGKPCHLHGGNRGFDRLPWDGTPSATGAPAIQFRRRSPDGEEGYPGNLDVKVTYTLGSKNDLQIDYEATTDRPTPLNLTNHSFFNLAGEGTEPILGHVVTLKASRYTPVDAGLIPTGEIASLTGTPLDFREPHPIGERIEALFEQLRLAGGYDHNYVLDGAGGALTLIADVFEPRSGRLLEVLTTEPAVQFYSGNFLDGTVTGKNGHRYGRRTGFCLETQHYPDSPNQPSFPSTILRPGQTFRSTTVYRISAH